MKKEDGISLARELKKRLLKQGVPVQKVYLFGSVARGETHQWSDVDIAVVCLPFQPTRLEENVEVSKAREAVDLCIETVCLHPEDLLNKYSTIAQELKKHGIEV
jgi:predicted nucleotidyltransferase